MQYQKEELSMSDGARVTFHGWEPEGGADAVVLLSHGMAEHASRYGRFAEALTGAGFSLYAEDHRGHGETGLRAAEQGSGALGFLAEHDGFVRVAEDIHEEVGLLRARFPGKRLFLFGHSFGSFVAQYCMETYGSELDGCILCGTAGPRPLFIAMARLLQGAIVRLTGPRTVSGFVSALSFGSYNARIRRPRTPADWLTRDEAEVDAYIADPLCGFTCTVGFFGDLTHGLSLIHSATRMRGIPQGLPVLLVSGTGDPVGSYAKTVQRLYRTYTGRLGLSDVTLRLYPDARHELLNETNREEVTQDVLGWLKSRAR